MSLRSRARATTRAKRGIIDIAPIGVASAKHFIQDQHGVVHLPKEDVFAFVANCDTPSKVYVVVSEPDKRLEIVGCTWHKEFDMTDERFDQLVRTTEHEAHLCGLEPPFCITFATQSGIFSFPYEGEQRRGAA